jgi:hypothetical protein
LLFEFYLLCSCWCVRWIYSSVLVLRIFSLMWRANLAGSIWSYIGPQSRSGGLQAHFHHVILKMIIPVIGTLSSWLGFVTMLKSKIIVLGHTPYPKSLKDQLGFLVIIKLGDDSCFYIYLFSHLVCLNVPCNKMTNSLGSC